MNECWEWNGTRNAAGYGVKNLKLDGVWKTRLTHRVAWEWANGSIPDGLCVCHACDNPPCCNPDHLFLGTQRENMHDALKKGRLNFFKMIKRRHVPPRQTECARGHAFTAENTIVKPGGRSCRACANEMQRLRRIRNGHS